MIKSYQRGFTLFELVITMMIVAILAAIAYPNYQRYIVKNAEEEAKAQIGQLELQLQRWRASALTYRGFMPVSGTDASGNATYGYRGENNTTIFIPLGSNENNFRYRIELVDIEAEDIESADASLVPTGSNVEITKGRGYKMIAFSSTSLSDIGARPLIVLSTGTRCIASRQATVEDMVGMQTTDTCATNDWEVW